MMPRRKLDAAIFGIASNSPSRFCRERFTKCKSLYRKDLLGHFGCVNAVEFSNDGHWLVSGTFCLYFLSEVVLAAVLPR